MKIDKGKYEKKLGIITDTMLGIDDHGWFTFGIGLDFGDVTQSFGTAILDAYDEKSEKRIGTAEGCEAIMRVLEAVGAGKWESLVGREVWAYREKPRGPIAGIAAPDYRDVGRPFFLNELFK